MAEENVIIYISEMPESGTFKHYDLANPLLVLKVLLFLFLSLINLVRSEPRTWYKYFKRSLWNNFSVMAEENVIIYISEMPESDQ